jgi:hypothetical protein
MLFNINALADIPNAFKQNCWTALLDSKGGDAQHWHAMKEPFSAELAGIALPDCDGGEIVLGSLWSSRPAVLIFLRHYG